MKRREIESRLRAMRLVEPRPELKDVVMATAARSRPAVAPPRTAHWPGRGFWVSWATAMVLVVAGEVVVTQGARDRRLATGSARSVSDWSIDLQQETGEEIPRRVLARIERADEPNQYGAGTSFRDEEIASFMR